MRVILIDMTENDCETLLKRVVYGNDTVEWSFPDQYGEEVCECK